MRRYDEEGNPIDEVKFEPPEGLTIRPNGDSELVRNYIKDKYFPEELNDDAIKEAQAGAQRTRTIAGIGSGVDSIVAGLTGIDPASKFYDRMASGADQGVKDLQERRKAKMDEATFARQQQAFGRDEEKFKRDQELQDPNSAPSRVFQNALKNAAPGMFSDEDLATVTANDKDRVLSLAQLKETIAARKASDAAKRQEKLDTKNQKTTQQVREIQSRANDIETNLTELERMIGEKGTWELTGSHNQDLDRKIDQVATDMAKLQDPESVARPAEVDTVKRNLIKSGFGNSNATAIDILRNFRKEVDNRVQNAYKVRGMEAPASGDQDKQALEWAKKNPTDERAKRIMKRLGGR